MPTPLVAALPTPWDPDAFILAFDEWAASRGLRLYPAQEEAVLELVLDRHLVLSTPTGTGKSLVAVAAHAAALAQGRRSFYTAPLKALVSEKFFSLVDVFGPENVGMVTGDSSVNPDAPIICCTAEILANLALRQGPAADVDVVIADEFHFYADPQRGWAWQVPLLVLANTRFVLMSATLGDLTDIAADLERRTGVEVAHVTGVERPVPLHYRYVTTPVHETVESLLEEHLAPAYIVHFAQAAAVERAQALLSARVASREHRDRIADEIGGFRFSAGFGSTLSKLVRAGIGVHHAGMLPKYRRLVEQLAQRGLLRVICGTDTLGVGINVPIRTVVFTQLWKYDGNKAAILSVRDFRQVAGRAGRAGYDTTGYVVVQAPEHIIANKQAEAKAAADPAKKKKLVKQSAPEGSVGWDAKTFERLMTAPSEELQSRFSVSHGMLLLMLGRDTDGCRAMQRLIRDCHETPTKKNALRRRAWQLFRALVDRKIVEILPRNARPPSGRKVRVNVELQDDFSLHQALSLYLIDTLPQLDRESADYPFDVLTLCEAIVEDPDQILRKQVDRLKTEKLNELKAAGVPYDERMAQLEEITEHPKPKREFLYDTFNAFAAAHPWVEQENVRPKSIAREMFERYLSFADYIRDYGLERGEGLLLRHLMQTFKVLSQTVPESFKTEPVVEMEDYFRELIRGIDSSLLEEWERLRNPEFVAAETTDKPARPASFDVTRDAAAFKRAIRTAVLGFLQDVAARDWEAAAARVTPPSSVVAGVADPGHTTLAEASAATLTEARRIEKAFASYFDARGRFRLDPEGRAAVNTHFIDDADPWEIAQVLIDPAGANDWEAVFTLSLPASRAASAPVLQFEHVAEIGTA